VAIKPQYRNLSPSWLPHRPAWTAVGSAQQNVGAAGCQRAHQIGGFASDVQTSRHLQAGQRLFFSNLALTCLNTGIS